LAIALGEAVTIAECLHGGTRQSFLKKKTTCLHGGTQQSFFKKKKYDDFA
jgi:hypothetical protein